MLKAHAVPFVVDGNVGLAAYTGRFVDGDLVLRIRAEIAPAAVSALSASGFRVTVDERRGEGVVDYAGHLVRVSWRLPDPLGGEVDDAWFTHGRRGSLVGIRVRFAPIEEMLWVRIAVPGAQSLCDPAIPTLFGDHGRTLAWDRLLLRLAGMEALFLSHLFLLHHVDPGHARSLIPAEILQTLLHRMNSGAADSVETSTH